METTLNPPMTRLTKGYLIALVGTMIWSTTAIFIRFLSVNTPLPPMTLAFWRDLFAALVLAGMLAVARPEQFRPGRGNLLFLALYGLELSVFNALWTVSVALNGAAVSTVLAYSSAAFTAVAGWRFFGESLDRTKLIAVGLSLAGCAFVSGAYDPSVWQVNPVGVGTGLLSGVAFAGYSLFGKAASNRGIQPWTSMLYTFMFAALYLFAYNLLGLPQPGLTGRQDLFVLGGSLVGWGLLFLLAAGPTIGGYGLYTVSLTYLPASVANLIATLEPAMTAVLAYFLLQERLTGVQLAGSLLIISGVILLRMREREPRAEFGD